MEKKDIRSWNQKELEEYLVSLGEKPFRAKQIYSWIHEKQAASFEEMTNISKKLKEKFAAPRGIAGVAAVSHVCQ